MNISPAILSDRLPAWALCALFVALFGHLGAAGCGTVCNEMAEAWGRSRVCSHAGGSKLFSTAAPAARCQSLPVEWFGGTPSVGGPAGEITFAPHTPGRIGKAVTGNTQSGRDPARAVKRIASAQPMRPTTLRPAAAMPGWKTRPLAEAAGRATFVS
jgi:hypothetical protein